MQPTQELIDDIYREKVLRARQTPPEQKVQAGPRMFELACQLAMAGIRDRYPDADEAQVRQILTRQLARVRKLGDRR
ncbi:MAG: hypothetical protein HZA46_13715 [Planctomycetales bacterium]|nr:hypothetical protein [Planctomycetales bacterium]